MIRKLKEIEGMQVTAWIAVFAALQFPLGHKIVTSVIPGPRSKNELNEIMEWHSFEVPAAFWTALKSKNLIHEDAPISFTHL